MRRVRFRTLGCYPLTAAIESDAATLAEIVAEMFVARTSERQGRLIDHDEAGVDGDEEARGLLLMAHTLAESEAFAAFLADARGQEPAPLPHLRQRRRRQVDADRPAALRFQAPVRGPARDAPARFDEVRHRPAATSISRCSSTASSPSASRASPSTSPTAISPPTGAASSSPTRPATSSTRATWRPAPRPPISPCSWSTPATASSPRPAGTPTSSRCSASGTSCSRSTRSTSSASTRSASATSRDDFAEFAAPFSFDDASSPSRSRRASATTSSTRSARTRPGTTGRRCSSISRRSTVEDGDAAEPFRFPVQWVNRPERQLPRLCRHRRRRRRAAGRQRRGRPHRPGGARSRGSSPWTATSRARRRRRRA